MAEVNDTSNGTELNPEEVKSFLEEFGFDGLDKAREVFTKYKTDIKELKGKTRSVDELEKKLTEYEKAAEEKRKSELSEVDRLRETLEEKDRAFKSVQEQIENMKKERVFDKVMFEHLRDKSLTKTRSQLYAIAVKSNEWSSAEELQEILNQVDKEFDAEIESTGVKLPLPGDGDGASRSMGTKYDQSFFDNFYKKK